MNDNYDVVILGGGLAGLTLSLQLKQANSDISILILEKREAEAPVAAHKVGESTVELGTYYLREVLNLKDYLDKHQLPKHGLRFFFTPQHKEQIEKRVELGPRERLPVPSHQIDRGVFENELSKRTTALRTDLLLSASVKDVIFSKDHHAVSFTWEGKEHEVQTRWVVDATGRRSFLKRKLGFQKPIDHNINAVWFRMKGEIDVDDWSEDSEWRSFLKPGLRRLGTIHLMDKGYWVWLIPLVSGNTSIGIVADPAVHPFEEFNRFEKAMDWISRHEPLCAKVLESKRDDLMDFQSLKHFSYHSGKFFSSDRWGVTGESGAFLDPFYSPGTDFISMANCWLTDLIIRDLQGEDIDLRVSVYEQMHTALIDSWLPLYQNKYPLMGRTQIMVVKIFWDWATYWGILTLLFTNKGMTNIMLIKKLFSKPTSELRKFGDLNKKVQDLFIAWEPYDTETFTNHYIDPFDIDYLRKFHKELEEQFEPKELAQKLTDNMRILEKIAAEIFRRVSAMVKGTPPDLKVDPYTMDLEPENPSAIHETGPNGIEPDPEIAADLDKMWYYEKKVLA